MIVGYIREKGEDEARRQEERLRDWGAQEIVWEKPVQREWVRPQYDKLAQDCQAGDTVVVTALPQLAGNARDILVMIHRLVQKGVTFVSLREDFRTDTPAGKETLRVTAYLAQLEEGRISRRQANVEKAKAAGKYKGRTPLYVDEKAFRAVCARWQAGEMTAVAAMAKLGLKPNTFYRRVKDLGIDLSKK